MSRCGALGGGGHDSRRPVAAPMQESVNDKVDEATCAIPGFFIFLLQTHALKRSLLYLPHITPLTTTHFPQGSSAGHTRGRNEWSDVMLSFKRNGSLELLRPHCNDPV